MNLPISMLMGLTRRIKGTFLAWPFYHFNSYFTGIFLNYSSKTPLMRRVVRAQQPKIVSSEKINLRCCSFFLLVFAAPLSFQFRLKINFWAGLPLV